MINSTSTQFALIKDYANALFSSVQNIPKEQNQSEQNKKEQNQKEQEILKQLKESYQIIAGSSLATKAINSLALDKTSKIKLIDAIAAKTALNRIVVKFLRLLIKNDRFSLLLLITEAYQDLINEAKGIQIVNVFSPAPLNLQNEQLLQNFLTKKLNKIVQIHNQQNPYLIGGVTIKYGNNLADYSVSGILTRLDKTIKQLEL